MSDPYSGNPFAGMFTFGTTDTPTYEELKRRRAIAAAIAGRQKGFPKNIGEGLTALGEGLYEGISDWRLRQQEEKSKGINAGLRSGPPGAGAAPGATTPSTGAGAVKPSGRLPGADPILSPGGFTPVKNLWAADGVSPTGPPETPVVAPADPYTAAPATSVPTDAADPYAAAGPDVMPPPPQEEEGTNPATIADAVAPPSPPPEAVRNNITAALMQQERNAPAPAAAPLALPEGALSPEMTYPGGTPARGQAAPIERRVLEPQGWAATDPRWRALDDDQKAAAMSMMEANSGPNAGQDRANVLAAIHNRADRDKATIGSSVSRRVYQPVIEANQQARLDRILADPEHARLTALSQEYGAGGERPHDATHFLAPEKTMLALSAREPGKYRTASWQKWTGFDPETQQYSGVKLRDSSHAFLTPPGEEGPPPRTAGPPVRMVNTVPGAGMDEQPPPVQQAAYTPDSSDQLLSEVTGGRPGLAGRGATASLGREGVASDVPAIGGAGNIGAGNAGLSKTLEDRRNAITGVISGTEPPPPTPTTLAQAPGATATDASMFDPRPVRTIPIGPNGAIQPAPGSRPNEAITKAPTKPSEEEIPPTASMIAKHPGELRPEPKPLPVDPREAHWRNVIRHPSADPTTQAYAKEQAEQFERARLKADERAREAWTFDRGKHQSQLDRYEESVRNAPKDALEQHRTRLDIQIKQAEEAGRPDLVRKLKAEVVNLEHAGTKSKLEIDKMQEEAALRKQYSNLPQEKVVESIVKSQTAANSDAGAYGAAVQAKKALDGGAILGIGADKRLVWAKLMNYMGLEDRGNDIANTEAFRAHMAPIVASTLKNTTGTTQVSDGDRRFALDAAGGNINLDEKSVRKMIDVLQRVSVENVEKHHAKMDAIYPGNKAANALWGVELPVPEEHKKLLRENRDNPHYTNNFTQRYGKRTMKRVLDEE